MDKCKDCYNMDCIFISEPNGCDAVETCDYFQPMTNADRIRAMSDEEMAEKISGIESFALTCGGGWPPEKWLDWLKQEA